MITNKKKIWLDLVNSPQVLFFEPIIKELRRCGYNVIITTKDCLHVCNLADRMNLQYRCIGRHFGKNKILKLIRMFIRVIQLIPIAIKEKPSLALSYGSRDQLILTSILHIPSVLITDYEYSQFLPLNVALLIVPEVIPEDVFRNFYKSIIKHPGIKEDVYVPFFKPDSRIKKELKLNDNNIVITIRPPATEAHYHNPQSEKIFNAVINHFTCIPNIQMVILPRYPKQATIIKKRWLEEYNNAKIIVPDRTIDGLNLIWYSDLVVSGGGTMNREATALGVPVYSIYQGKIGAVDQYLVDTGRLVLIESVDDIKDKIKVIRRKRSEKIEKTKSDALVTIVNSIINIIEDKSV